MNPTVILVVVMNAASTQAIPLGAFETMELCEAKRPLVTEAYIAEWPAARLECIPITYAPLTSPRPQRRI